MFEDRDQRTDLIALVLFGATAFLGLSLLSYSPADPVGDFAPLSSVYKPTPVVYPQAEQVGNMCGSAGAYLAGFMLTAFGWGAHYILVSLTLLAFSLLFRRPMTSPIPRMLGWVMTLFAIATFSNMFTHSLWNGPVIGPGGYLGALCTGILSQHFALPGSVIITFSVMLAGILLCTDYLMFQLLGVVGAASVDRVIARRSAATRKKADGSFGLSIGGKRVADASDLDDDVYEDEAEYEDEEYADDEYEYEDEEQEEEDEQDTADENESDFVPAAKKALRGIIGRAAPAVRVGKTTNKVDEREEVIAQLEEAIQEDEPGIYDLPSISLLKEAEEFNFSEQEKECRRKAKVLEKTFADFGFDVKVVDIEMGPVIAQYEIALEAGLRLSKITGLADDLAIALRAPSVRIVAPIPGKNTVGIEVPNETRQTVRMREVMQEMNSSIRKMQIPLFLGKDVSGNPLTVDLAKMPHLLIAGRTGTGKSVCLNAIISSILMTRRPDEVRMLMIDPKMVELSGYKTLPHLMHPVVTDMRKAEALLAWAVDKMEERYQLLARAGVRQLSAYNQLGEEELMERLQPEDDDERVSIPLNLPYIVIVADEMADLMMTSGKEVEQHIIRLAQKSRAVGIHLILATQKPTVDVITGLIKSNLPARLCFQVASKNDSRVVLDENGADKLLGHGDMLFLSPGTSTVMRGQGTFLDDSEIIKLVESVSTGEQNFVNELVHLKVEDPETDQPGSRKGDDLYDSAVEVVIREGRGSISLLQRVLGIGYGRAARMIDWMAEDGVVGTYSGQRSREVVMTMADWEARQSGEPIPPSDPEPEPTPPPISPPKKSPGKNPAGKKAAPRKSSGEKILSINNFREDEATTIKPSIAAAVGLVAADLDDEEESEFEDDSSEVDEAAETAPIEDATEASVDAEAEDEYEYEDDSEGEADDDEADEEDDEDVEYEYEYEDEEYDEEAYADGEEYEDAEDEELEAESA